jgi:hypothetical protein
VGNLHSVIFNSAFALGGLAGPLLAGVIVNATDNNFPLASSIYGVSCLGFLIIYLVFGRNIKKKNYLT